MQSVTRIFNSLIVTKFVENMGIQWNFKGKLSSYAKDKNNQQKQTLKNKDLTKTE